MNQGLFIFLVVLLLCGIEFATFYLVKTFVESNTSSAWWQMFLAVLLYGSIPLQLWWILEYSNTLGVINAVWNVLSTVYGVLLGYYLFSETFTTIQFVGLGIGLTGIILILWPDFSGSTNS